MLRETPKACQHSFPKFFSLITDYPTRGCCDVVMTIAFVRREPDFWSAMHLDIAIAHSKKLLRAKCNVDALMCAILSALRTQVRDDRPARSERHRRFVRTGLSARFANFVREAAMAAATDPIGVETVVPGGDDQRGVAINVDAVRSRAAPGQVRRAPPVH